MVQVPTPAEYSLRWRKFFDSRCRNAELRWHWGADREIARISITYNLKHQVEHKKLTKNSKQVQLKADFHEKNFSANSPRTGNKDKNVRKINLKMLRWICEKNRFHVLNTCLRIKWFVARTAKIWILETDFRSCYSCRATVKNVRCVRKLLWEHVNRWKGKWNTSKRKKRRQRWYESTNQWKDRIESSGKNLTICWWSWVWISKPTRPGVTSVGCSWDSNPPSC